MRLLLACVTVLCLLGVVLHAADNPAVGSWTWTANPEEGDPVKGSMEIKDDGGKLAGVLILHEGDRCDLVNPKLDGDQLTFTVTVGDNTYDVTVTVAGGKFNGKFKGDAARGTIEGTKKV